PPFTRLRGCWGRLGEHSRYSLLHGRCIFQIKEVDLGLAADGAHFSDSQRSLAMKAGSRALLHCQTNEEL
ncbi:Delta3_5-Delta2_4-dienoyl-CoA isomerase_ mitochondrial, partial [Caligus rogercresseyi]